MASNPLSPLTDAPLRVYAILAHELFSELVRAGFEEKIAIRLLIGLMDKPAEGQ